MSSRGVCPVSSCPSCVISFLHCWGDLPRLLCVSIPVTLLTFFLDYCQALDEQHHFNFPSGLNQFLLKLPLKNMAKTWGRLKSVTTDPQYYSEIRVSNVSVSLPLLTTAVYQITAFANHFWSSLAQREKYFYFETNQYFIWFLFVCLF